MWLGSLLLAIVPHEAVVIDYVDVTEINRVYDECGKLVFTQAIYWTWDPWCCRLQVRAWRMVKNFDQYPRVDHGSESAFSLWNDSGVLREVRAKAVRESWTQYDPEMNEREVIPKELRRELRTR